MATRNPNPAAILSQVIQETWTYVVADLARWKQALQQARDPRQPRRWAIQQIYENVAADAHVQSCLQARTLRVKSEDFYIVRRGTTDQDTAKTALLNTPWFVDFLEFAQDAVYFGTTLIELGAKDEDLLVEGELTGVELIPRANVVPEQGLFLPRVSQMTGIEYRKPPYDATTLEVGRREWLGLLQYIVPEAIFKKRANAAWDRFLQLYGVPVRWAEVEGSLPSEEIEKLDHFLTNMSQSGWMRVPAGTKLNVERTTTSGSGGKNPFLERAEFSNAEISKLILLGTMVTEDGSSRSQSEVHERQSDNATRADLQSIQFLVNWQLLPMLAALGYPFVKDDEFVWQRDIDQRNAQKQRTFADLEVKEQFDLALALVNTGAYQLPAKFFAERFGLPVAEVKRIAPPGTGNPAPGKTKPEPAEPEPDPDPAPPAPRPKPKNKLTTAVNQGPGLLPPTASFNADACGCEALPAATGFDNGRLNSCTEILLKEVFEGRKAGNDPVTYSAQYTTLASELLRDALGTGWQQGSPALDFAPDYLARQFQEFNVIRFSAAKSYAVATELNRLAGQATSFADFRTQSAPLVQNVNETWMRTEYDMTRQVGYTSAAYWRRVGNVENGYTAWKYETAGDDRVRPAHRALDGMTRPWDDAVWDTLQVPNGWRCRCDIVAVRGAGVTEDDLNAGREQADRFMASPEFQRLEREGFAINRAKLGVVFTEAQLYSRSFNERGLGVKANGVQPWAVLRGGTLPQLPKLDRKREDAIAWFEQHPGRDREASPTAIKLLDYAGREVWLTMRTLERHLTQKYLNEGRQEILELLPDVLTNPDEVYLLRTEHKQGNPVWQLGYFKHYQNGPLFVPVLAPGDELLLKLANGPNLTGEELEAMRAEARAQISTWYILNGQKADQTRQGILLHKK